MPPSFIKQACLGYITSSCVVAMQVIRSLGAAESSVPLPATNATVAAAKGELATIPDASYRPVLITNSVTIAGEHVTYSAETGMLPVLKSDGTSRASVV